MFVNKIDQINQKYNLLNHAYYQLWNAGKLSVEDLRHYACQYFKHVEAIPRYLSTIHSKCQNIKIRQILLDNLIDEEEGEENHPELWLRFGESLGLTREKMIETPIAEAKNLVDGFFNLCQNHVEGIGAMYAYEKQIPLVAQSKMNVLKEFYGITDERSLKFFTIHIKADEWHAQELSQILEDFSAEEKKSAIASSNQSAKLLWNFLDSMLSHIAAC